MLLQRCRSVSPPRVFLVTIILIVRWRAVSSWKGIAKTTRAEKKNQWKVHGRQMWVQLEGQVWKRGVAGFSFFLCIEMNLLWPVLFRLLLFSFINIMNLVNEGTMLLPQKLFHVLSVKTNKQNFIIFTALCSDWNSCSRNLPQLCLFKVFLVLFRSLMFDLVEFRFLYFTITHLGMKPNQKEPFVKGLWWRKKAPQN